MQDNYNDTMNPQDKKTKNSVKPLGASELAAFAGQLSLIIHAGLSVGEGLDIMMEDAENAEEKQILQVMKDELDITGLLSNAMDEAGVFPKYMVHMVETGERTGNLDEVMDTLETHYQRENEMRKSIYQAVVYPVILSIMVIAVILVLLVQVMPVFDQIFSELGTSMTGLPLVLTSVGKALSGSGFAIIAIVLVVAVVLLVMGRSEGGSAKLSALAHRIPGIKKTRHAEAACRFAGHMALTLASGLTTEEGVEMAKEMNEDPEFAKMLDDCGARLDDGENFARALVDSGIFSGIYAQLVATGSKTGNMDTAMERIADLYRDELDEQITRRLSKLEPTLIVILSVIVGGILLSVMLPLLNIMSAI